MPRAGLNEERVLDAADVLANEVGLANLTLSALAARLGVRQPSLYKHINGLPGLLRGMSIRAKEELASILARAAVGRSRADALESMSNAYRDWAGKHPGQYEAAQRAPDQGDEVDERASLTVVQVCSDVLAGYGLEGDDAIDAIRAMRASLHGFVILELGGGFGLPVSIDRSFQVLIEGLVLSFAHWSERDLALGSKS
jgi:AcrR family transcriptional regulator